MDTDQVEPAVEEARASATDQVAEGIPPEGDGEGGALDHLRLELESLTDRHLRLAAEFDNYRRRVERERVEYRVRAQADLVLPLLDLLDDLQRVSSIDSGGTTVGALLEGVQLIEKKFRHALETEGLEPIDAAGEYFNPATMEALMTVEAEHAEEDDQVADVFQKGYRFKDILIRPARVRVKKYDV
jgi:molecular chaperone GrpE